MIISDLSGKLNTYEKPAMTYVSKDGGNYAAHFFTAREHLLNVRINGEVLLDITCTPDHLPELVIGRLLSEGIITSSSDIESIFINESGSTADVKLKIAALFSPEAHCTLATTGGTFMRNNIPLKKVNSLEPDPEWIIEIARRFEEGDLIPIFIKTHSVHSCLLADCERIIYVCEDIGRHNAMDKVIGCALRDDIDLSKCILFSSGRLPKDMASKAIHAGIPVLVSKALASSESMALASRYGLKLVLQARKDGCLIIN